MLSDLLACKKEATAAVNGENPPKRANGRKVGYIELMHKFWIDKGKGYVNLNLSLENLSDQARRVECKQTTFLSPISQTVDDEHNNLVISQNLTVNTVASPVNSVDTVESNKSNSPLNDDKINRLIAEADIIYSEINCIKGDCSKRTFTTRFRTAPTGEDIRYVNHALQQLLNVHNIKDLQDMQTMLWNVNCLVYAVIIGWIKVNDIRGLEEIKRKGNQPNKNNIPKCVQIVEIEIKEVRSRLSKCKAEIERLTVNGRLTKKGRRNRQQIQNECGEISHYVLVCYMEKLKKRIKYLSKKRSRKLRNEKARLLNNEFQKNQKGVFDKFRNSINEDSDLKPVYTEKVTEKKYFEDPKLVEKFWSELWEKEDAGNPDAAWVSEIKDKFFQLIPDVYDGDLEITMDVCKNTVRKKKNWSAPGPDKITNFWWKKLPCIMKLIVDLFHNIINVLLTIERWVCAGRVALLPKEGVWSEANQRPITCLNTIYKWITSVLLHFHNEHLNKYRLSQVDQRGAMKNSSGTVNNLLIDDVVMRDARMHHRNLFCYWVDVRKAFDSVSHSWLIKMLEIHRFPTKLITVFRSIITKWSVSILIPVKDGYTESRSILLTNGILQGDSYCPALYILTMNIISWVLRSFEGYRMSKPISLKITHTLYIDDLKGYANTLPKLEYMLNLIQSYMEDAGLIWNQKKSKFMVLKRGKFTYVNDITLLNGLIIKCLEEDESYEFMGVPQQTKMDDEELGKELLKIVKQRSYIIWSSELSDVNKCKSINQFVNSSVDYYFWAVKFPLNLIKEMDISIRSNMNLTGSKHTNLTNVIKYLPRKSGGRGLRSLEETYKTTKIKLAVKLSQEDDQRLTIVRKFHMIHTLTNSFSIFKDADRYALEIGLKMNVNDDNIAFVDMETRENVNNKLLRNKIKSKVFQQNHTEVLDSSWQGVNLKQRIEDEDVMKGYFDWLDKWRTCPTSSVQEFFLLFYQLLPTLTYQSTRTNEIIDDTRCRLCKSGQESVKHLISNCGDLANSLYKSRHDNALKCFIWPLLHHLELTTKCPSWCASDKVSPYYENTNARFWWDIPEYTGKDEELKRPPRPDGKLIINNGNEKKVYLVEMTVPWTENRKSKYDYKATKYKNILHSLQFEYPDHKVDQLTIVMDVFGGYGQDLIDNISKVIQCKSNVKSIITSMQKSVISGAANLSRTFKIRSSNV